MATSDSSLKVLHPHFQRSIPQCSNRPKLCKIDSVNELVVGMAVGGPKSGVQGGAQSFHDLWDVQ